MNAATHHAERARRLAPFLHETMRGRGLGCQRGDLEQALLEVTPAQLQQVYAAADQLSRGADARDAVNLLAALRTVSARAARLALREAGILYRADVLLPLGSSETSGPAFKVALASLQRTELPAADRAQARESLLACCGPLDHSDLLAPAAEPPVEIDPSDPRETEATGAAAGLTRIAPPSPASARRSGAAARQVKIYGKAAALTCEAAPVRARAGEQEERSLSTVIIEGANARGDGTYDWAAKTVFSCGLRELPQLLAALLGWLDEVEFKFHGERSDKQLLLQHQEHGLYLRLREAGSVIGVPITPPDRYALAILTLNVMASNEPHCDATAVLAVCREVMGPPPSRR